MKFKRKKGYVNKPLRQEYIHQDSLPRRDYLIKDSSYNQGGQISFNNFGSLGFLFLLNGLNKISPSLVTILLGGKK